MPPVETSPAKHEPEQKLARTSQSLARSSIVEARPGSGTIVTIGRTPPSRVNESNSLQNFAGVACSSLKWFSSGATPVLRSHNRPS